MDATPEKVTEETQEKKADWKKRLFTAEDRFYIHKILGLTNLIFYFYKYIYAMIYHSLGFRNDTMSYMILIFANLLSCSSLIFHVIPKRIVSNPLIIYEEYRLHAIVFTLRATGVSLIGLFGFEKYLQLFILMIHLTVDWISRTYGSEGITTVRNGEEDKFKYLKLFYAYYQILILATHLVPDSDLINLGYNGIIAIHSSAFLMTLKRKGLIRWQTHAFWYTLALLVSMWYVYLIKGSIFFCEVFFFFILRTQFKLSKYIVWGLFLARYFYFA